MMYRFENRIHFLHTPEEGEITGSVYDVEVEGGYDRRAAYHQPNQSKYKASCSDEKKADIVTCVSQRVASPNRDGHCGQ